MFGWRRKSDGFEWQKYVRTTIKLRREERAKKIDEIKQAAASGAMAAGRQSVSAGRSGAGALLLGIKNGALWLWAALKSGARRIWAWLGDVLSRVGRKTGDRSRLLPVVTISARMKIAAMFGGLGLLAGLSAFLQYRQSGADWSAVLAGMVAVTLLGLAVAPWLRRMWDSARGRLRTQNFQVSLPETKWASAVAGAVVAVGLGIWGWQSGGISAAGSTVLSALPSWSSLPSAVTVERLEDISGRARAITGDTVRIGSRLVRLAGIEAPEISQVCRDKRNRAWRCGQRARSALRRVIGPKTVVCENVAKAEGGRFQATCRIGEQDIAAEIVKKGYAFAEGVIFKSYASAEDEAREAVRGIWQGEFQRPADFRAKRWEVASKSAPDGCPIKGRVVRRSKVYVLPWAMDYRQVRIRRARGERWFCSESEATDAGFKPSTTG